MGSGLILLLIVGAWLAVLVPMALRSHEASGALATADKFSDAMRVLSRRSRAAQAEGSRAAQAEGSRAAQAEGSRAAQADGCSVPAADHVPEADAVPDLDPALESDRALGPVRQRSSDAVVPSRRFGWRARRARRPALTPAARRLRALLVLVALAVVTLVGAVVGSWWLLLPHLVMDVLLLGFLCWLRSQAVAKEEREWRRAMEDPLPAPISRPVRRTAPPAAVSAAVAPARVAGTPDRMPSRAQLVAAAHRLAAVPAARAEDVPQVRGAQGEPWQPVPVPVPTYISAPAAPRRVLDLTRASAATTPPAPQRSDAVHEASPELDHILDRRAVGD